VVHVVLFTTAMDRSNFRRPPLVAEDAVRPLTDAEQIALSALAGAFTGFLIWLYWVVFRFAVLVMS
jgi:hypothetical protein